MSGTKPRSPAGMTPAGRALWKSLTGAYEFDQREAAILAAACRQADDIGRLEALLAVQGLVTVGAAGQPRLSAVLAELRQGRLALAKLLDSLRIPDDSGKVETQSSRRARHAAETRWALERQRQAVR